MATAVAAQGSEPARAEPRAIAREAGLRYVTDRAPGIRRRREGDEFRYLDAQGEEIRDEAVLQRIRTLGIPPAYVDVWICPQANGHLQATGRDAKGRKQYRYHPRWRAVRDEDKFERMIAFGRALPAIRARVEHDLGLRGMPREKVLAALVRLLETTLIRVGNEEYARTNKSFGLTTMRTRHVDIDGATIRFRFRGKSGKTHRIALTDRRLARIVARCRELPGQELFHYLDEDGEPRMLESADVNEYLRAISGQDFTAKDFRTWAGTVLAALALRACELADSPAQAKRNVVQAIESVSQRLGNTPSVCRTCYVHPGVIEAYLDGSLLEPVAGQVREELADPHALPAEEAAVLALLQQRLSSERAS